MELGINKEFLVEQFKNIEETYGLTWQDLDGYGGSLVNDKIQINIWTDRDVDGISAFLTNKEKNEDYFIFDFVERKGFNGLNYLTEEERTYSQTLNLNSFNIYCSSILLERYCQDVLSGDFSNVGPGESDEF